MGSLTLKIMRHAGYGVPIRKLGTGNKAVSDPGERPFPDGNRKRRELSWQKNR